VVGIYPDDAALLRLASGVLVEMNDEWLVARRYLSPHSMSLLEATATSPPGPSVPTRQLWRERWSAPESPPRRET
jgi:hypothetical protein